jgi:hypothetical protein
MQDAALGCWKQPGKLKVWLVACGYTALVMRRSAVQAARVAVLHTFLNSRGLLVMASATSAVNNCPAQH